MAELAIYRSTNFKTLTCGECGVEFAMLDAFYDKRREDKREWFCPNGHKRYFAGETEAEKLKKELEAQKRRTDMALADAKTETTRRLKAEREAKRLKKRVGNGVCPCCNRHFTNMERHMSTKHPDYKDDLAANPAEAKK